MNRRLRIARHWLAGSRHGVSPGSLLRFLTGPRCQTIAAREIVAVDDAGDALGVHLRGLAFPLLFPKEIDFFHLQQVIAESHNVHDWHYYEIAETRVRAGDVVVDCGAAEGLFAALAATRAARVYAVEPLPRFAELLLRTFAAVPNVTVVPVAVHARDGVMRLTAGTLDSSLTADAAGAAGGTDVPVRSLDSLAREWPALPTYIKADLEGADVAALEGAREVIARATPRIAITTYHVANHAERIEALLREVDRRYVVRVKGIADHGCPVMLHAWVPGR
jgi:FkbM family methyltransferase